MAFIIVWFIMTAPAIGVIEPGYIPPQNVHLADMQCGLPGVVEGVHVDRQVNPLKVRWPDPFFDGVHCEADISLSVAALLPGEYHIATTIVGADLPFGTPAVHVNEHDPHTTSTWLRDGGVVPPPTPMTIGQLRISPQ